MKELREAGHLVYETNREHGRITGWLIKVYEVPLSQIAAPDSDFLEVEKLQVENRTQVLKTLSTNESSIEREDEITKDIAAGRFPINPNTGQIITGWKATHADEWIIKAIEQAKARGARSLAYVDQILIGWEANGYPKPRDKQIEDARKQKPAYQQPQKPNRPKIRSLSEME